MSGVRRREALFGLGALAASAAFMRGGAAAVQPAGDKAVMQTKPAEKPQQGAGFYRFKVGEVECYSIGDSQARMDPFPLWGENASEEAVAAALRASALPAKQNLMHFNVLLMKTGNETWLVDAGNGPARAEPGMLMKHLGTLGVKAEDVSGIVLSHLHGDHFAGLMDKDGKLVFTNAKYFLNATECEFWSRTPDLSKTNLNVDWKKGMIEGAQKTLIALEASGKLNMVDDGAKLTSGISVKKTGGHTPGHQTVVVESGGKRFEMLADAVHHYVLSFQHPEWHLHFDYDAKEGARARREVLSRVASDESLVMCYHTPWPGVGRVIREGDGFAWMPTVWEW